MDLFSCYFWTEFLKFLVFSIFHSRRLELNTSESSFHDTVTTLDASNPKEFFQKFEFIATLWRKSEEWKKTSKHPWKDNDHIFYWSINFSQLTRFPKKRGKFIKNFLPRNVYLSIIPFDLSYLSDIDFIWKKTRPSCTTWSRHILFHNISR